MKQTHIRRLALARGPQAGDAVRHTATGEQGVVTQRLSPRRIVVQTQPRVSVVWYVANVEVI